MTDEEILKKYIDEKKALERKTLKIREDRMRISELSARIENKKIDIQRKMKR